MVVSLYTVLMSIQLILVYKKNIKTSLESFSSERKKLKNLEYYYVTDDYKVIDLNKRKTTFNLFGNMTMGAMYVLAINFSAIYYILQHVFEETEILKLVIVFIFSLIAFLGYGGLVVGIVFKYTTTVYVVMPFISATFYFLLLYSLVSSLPEFVKLAVYLFSTMIFYLILTYVLPIHILRKLNSKTVLISSFTTILTVFISQIFQFYFSHIVQSENYLLNTEAINNSTDITDSIKNVLAENPVLIEDINHFLVKETLSTITTMTGLLVTALTMSYITGGLIINRKIRKGRQKAKYIYRTLIKKENSIKYSILIKCAFYGGEEFENLLLNNNLTLNVIKENEIKLDIPDVSRKTRFMTWLRRNLLLYSFYEDIKKYYKF